MESYNTNAYTTNRQNNNNKYSFKNQQGFQLVDVAKSLINTRKNKLEYEKSMLTGLNKNKEIIKSKKGFPNSNEYSALYSLNNLIRGKNMMNPNLYSYQYIDPIYYPMEMPTNAEPMSLPKVEMGVPMHDPYECHCCGNGNDGIGLADLLGLLRPKKRKETPIIQKPITPIPKPITPIKIPTPKEEPKKEPPKSTNKKKDWWRIARAFVNIGKFYFISHKYGKFSHTRNELIGKNNQAIGGHQDTLINWFNTFLGKFYDEFREIPDLNLSFNNYSGKLKIQEQSQIIIALLQIFLKCLYSSGSKLSDLPGKVQEILYNYIKEKAYFSPKLLSTYEINRLDFNFYGGTKNHSDASIAMVLGLFLFSKTLVQRILLRVKEFVPDFKSYRYIDITMKYVGSILHYLVRDAFRGNPPMTKDVLALMNYYRNYHISNEAIERTSDVLNNNIKYNDIDEYSANLVPEEQITSFFQTNVNFCEKFKKLIFEYCVMLGRGIRLKYAKMDNNIKPKTPYI